MDCSPTNPRCECTKTVGGNRTCVDYTGTQCPTTDECDSNADCRGDRLCVQVGTCCGGSRRNLCAPPCG